MYPGSLPPLDADLCVKRLRGSPTRVGLLRWRRAVISGAPRFRGRPTPERCRPPKLNARFDQLARHWGFKLFRCSFEVETSREPEI